MDANMAQPPSLSSHKRAMSQLVTQGRKSRGWWQTPEDKDGDQEHSGRRSRLSCSSAGHTQAVWQTFRGTQTDQAAGTDSTGKKAPEDRACYGPCHIASTDDSTWPCLTLNGCLMQNRSTGLGI